MENGAIAEFAELERELSPELVGSAATSGSTQALARDRPCARRAHGWELRERRCGRLRTGPGSGRSARRSCSRRSPAARAAARGLLLNRARELVGGDGGRARRRGGRRPAALARLLRAPCRRRRRAGPAPVLGAVRGAAADRRAGRSGAAGGRRHGRGRAGRARRRRARAVRDRARRATGAAAYVEALEPLSGRPDEAAVFARARPPVVPARAARGAVPRRAAGARRARDIRGDLHCHTTWSDGRASVEEMGRAARERGYEYLAICDHTPAVGVVRGLTADDVRRQGEEIAAANEALAPFRILRGIECDILPDGRLDLPDDVLAELDWVQASVHGGQRMPRRGDDQARRGGAAQPVRALPEPSDGPAHRPPAGERARPRAGVRGRARARRRARGQRAPRPARPQRRARPRRAARRRADRLLDRRALGPRAREHGARGPHGAPRLGDGRDVLNTAPAGVDPQELVRSPRSRRGSIRRWRGRSVSGSGRGGPARRHRRRGVELAPAQRRALRGRLGGRRRRYGRSVIIASKASQTAMMREPSGISSPARPSG